MIKVNIWLKLVERKKKIELKQERQINTKMFKKLEKIRKEEIMDQYMKKHFQVEQQKMGMILSLINCFKFMN